MVGRRFKSLFAITFILNVVGMAIFYYRLHFTTAVDYYIFFDGKETAETVQILVWNSENWLQIGKSVFEINDVLSSNGEKSIINKDPQFRRCSFTTDRSLLSSSDAVVLDPSYLTGKGLDAFRNPPYLPKKKKFQQWVSLNIHRPSLYPLMNSGIYNIQTDFSVGHNTSDDIFVTYVCPYNNTTTTTKTTQKTRITLLDIKEMNPVVMIMNCNYTLRDSVSNIETQNRNYIKELIKFVDIHSYGDCFNNHKLLKGEEREEQRLQRSVDNDQIASSSSSYPMLSYNDLVSLYSNYKFVVILDTQLPLYHLSAAYSARSVPVYVGDKDYVFQHRLYESKHRSGELTLFSSDYPTVKAIAERINQLISNDEEYMLLLNKEHDDMDSSSSLRSSTTSSETGSNSIPQCIFNIDQSLCDMILRYKSSLTKNDLYYIKQHQLRSPGSFDDYAFQFDGTTRIKFPHHHSFNAIDTISITAWIWIDNSNVEAMRIIDKNVAGKLRGLSFDLIQENGNSNQIKYFARLCGGWCFTGSQRISFKTWTHIAITYNYSAEPNSRLVSFYVNGFLENTNTIWNPMPLNKFDLVIGGPSQGSAPYFKVILEHHLTHVVIPYR
eukprot:TRINITY_DN4144_c0_g1_i6.p1 TRINITY_DN4144_c0_g1~~TRINITY_DN4144_c0_g1_i6.p1  ORF type:complete len:608 (+),score=92.67 TRINITY_DN4144_c0_g1_i6:22-1845(+)